MMDKSDMSSSSRPISFTPLAFWVSSSFSKFLSVSAAWSSSPSVLNDLLLLKTSSRPDNDRLALSYFREPLSFESLLTTMRFLMEIGKLVLIQLF